MKPKPDVCATGCGSLPGSCANLAFPFISMQNNNPERYSQQDGMRAGTLFPGLHLPFHKEMKSRFPTSNNALTELMALDFAIQELGLYLTTHRDDAEVLNLFRAYVKLAKEGREKYEESYGPLYKTDDVGSGFAWLDNPWPWDLGGND